MRVGGYYEVYSIEFKEYHGAKLGVTKIPQTKITFWEKIFPKNVDVTCKSYPNIAFKLHI